MDKTSYEVFELLCRLGVSANYNGFAQTACAVKLCRDEPERLTLVTKRVYPDVASLCGTSCSAVERNIRTACGIAWKNNRRLLEHLACKPFPQKPHNTQFLAILLYSLLIYQPLTEKSGLIDLFPPRFREKGNSGKQEKSNKGT